MSECKDCGNDWRYCDACMERLHQVERERDEARSFAQGVYRWGPREQWETWEKSLPWLTADYGAWYAETGERE